MQEHEGTVKLLYSELMIVPGAGALAQGFAVLRTIVLRIRPNIMRISFHHSKLSTPCTCTMYFVRMTGRSEWYTALAQSNRWKVRKRSTSNPGRATGKIGTDQTPRDLAITLATFGYSPARPMPTIASLYAGTLVELMRVGASLLRECSLDPSEEKKRDDWHASSPRSRRRRYQTLLRHWRCMAGHDLTRRRRISRT